MHSDQNPRKNTTQRMFLNTNFRKSNKFNNSSLHCPQLDFEKFQKFSLKCQKFSHYQEEKCSVSTILANIQDLKFMHKNFKSSWNHLVAHTSRHLQFTNYIPVAISQLGAQLLNDCLFIQHWLQLMRMCPFVCFSIILRHAAKKYHACFQSSQELQQMYYSVFSNEMIMEQKQEMMKGSYIAQQSLKRNQQIQQSMQFQRQSQYQFKYRSRQDQQNTSPELTFQQF